MVKKDKKLNHGTAEGGGRAPALQDDKKRAQQAAPLQKSEEMSNRGIGGLRKGIMKGKKMKRISVRQRKLINYYLEGCTVRDAAIKAGYSKESAYTHGSRTLKRLYECGTLNETLEALGISDELLAIKIMEGLEATKPNGTPDYAVRHRYLETALKLRGALVERTNVEHECGDTLFDLIAKANSPEAENRDLRFEI